MAATEQTALEHMMATVAAEALAHSAERQLRERKDWRKNPAMLKFMESQAARLRHRATGIAEGWWDSDMEAASHVSYN